MFTSISSESYIGQAPVSDCLQYVFAYCKRLKLEVYVYTEGAESCYM